MKVYTPLLFLFITSICQAEIYIQIDENGRKSFTDRPPENSGISDRTVEREEAKRYKLKCDDLSENIKNNEYKRTKVEGNSRREFYYDSKIKQLKEEFNQSCIN